MGRNEIWIGPDSLCGPSCGSVQFSSVQGIERISLSGARILDTGDPIATRFPFFYFSNEEESLGTCFPCWARQTLEGSVQGLAGS